MSASLLATSLSNASGWRLMGLMRRGALFFLGWADGSHGSRATLWMSPWQLTLSKPVRRCGYKKNEAAVTGFFSLPPPFTAVAGTWDDIFLYFGSICCQLLIIPSAGWEEENCMSTSKWATTPAVVISEGEGWFHEQRQKGLKVSVRAPCHLLDTKDARERRRAGGLYSEYERQSVKAVHEALLLSFLLGS